MEMKKTRFQEKMNQLHLDQISYAKGRLIINVVTVIILIVIMLLQ